MYNTPQVDFSGPMTFFMIMFFVYLAFAWMTIAKKLGYDKPWLAWIPIVNIFLIPILANKHWQWGFIVVVPVANVVFFLMWIWNIYEQRNYPGALSLIPLAGIFPILSPFAAIGNLVALGLVAWKDR